MDWAAATEKRSFPTAEFDRLADSPISIPWRRIDELAFACYKNEFWENEVLFINCLALP